MTFTEVDEPISEPLLGLPTLESDPKRAERTRRYCRALLESRSRRREHVHSRLEIAQRGLERVVVGVACVLYVVYVTALVATTLQLGH